MLAEDLVRAGSSRSDSNSAVRQYQHAAAIRTNLRLQKLFASFEDHGLLYGSALASLLRADGRVSGALPNRAGALDYGARITRFVLDHMSNLRWMMCMGSEAWEVARSATSRRGRWEDHRDRLGPLGIQIAAFHPAARVGDVLSGRAWVEVARRIPRRAA